MESDDEKDAVEKNPSPPVQATDPDAPDEVNEQKSDEYLGHDQAASCGSQAIVAKYSEGEAVRGASKEAEEGEQKLPTSQAESQDGSAPTGPVTDKDESEGIGGKDGEEGTPQGTPKDADEGQQLSRISLSVSESRSVETHLKQKKSPTSRAGIPTDGKKGKNLGVKRSDSGKKQKPADVKRNKLRELESEALASLQPKVEKNKSQTSSKASSDTLDEEEVKNDANVEVQVETKVQETENVVTNQVDADPAQPNAEEAVRESALVPLKVDTSIDSMISRLELDDDAPVAEVIVWEWEQELDEYDEPDIYPSEKDYIMVPTQVEISDDEEEAEDIEQIAEERKEKGVKEADAAAEQYISKDPKADISKATSPGQETDTSTLKGSMNDAMSGEVIYDSVKETNMVKKEEAIVGQSTDLESGTGQNQVRSTEAKDPKLQKADVAEAQPIAGQVEETLLTNTNIISSEHKVKQQKSRQEVEPVEKEQTGDIEKADEPTIADEEGGKDQVEDKKGDSASIKMQKDDESLIEKVDINNEDRDPEDEEDKEEKREAKSKEDQEFDNVGKTPDDDEPEEVAEDVVREKQREEDEADEEVKDIKRGDLNETKDFEEKKVKEQTSAQSLASMGQEGEDKTGLDEAIDKEKEINEPEKEQQEDKEQEQPGQEDAIKSDEERKRKEEELKKLKAKRSTVSIATSAPQVLDVASVETGDEGAGHLDEFEVQGLAEPEPEPDEPKPKRYKTVMVRTLVSRPPKIHYVPEEERKTHLTNDKHLFRKRPISLVMSYGYDCQRMANLHVLDTDTVVFMSGFVLTFFNHKTKGQSYLRCIGGSCFGALAIHPSRRLFAAAEKGEKPIIGIWSWPKLQLFRRLREGTDKVYASVNFSPCGRFLASQGGEPDYLITVYNWLAEMPVVRVKSHAQDVFRVTFSKELAGRLTTAGLCHIKFWKMATTFTGLKLKGDIGRFGRTELSDIEGYVEMPDGKVLSGTEWGNLLLWENGLIVAEICIKPDIPCHEGIVRHVVHVETEFYTTGQDGWLRSWPFDTVDAAEIQTTEDSFKVAVKSSGQVLIKENSDIWYIVPDIADESSSSVFWFAQDGKGSIIRADLSFLNTAKDPFTVLTAHGGSIVGCATSKNNCIMATLGIDGQIRVYDYINHNLLACRTFSSAGTILVWPGVNLDPTCRTIIAGFADGTFRVILLSGEEQSGLNMSLVLKQVRKPHSKKLTYLSIDSNKKYLATGGEDGIIFFFDVTQDYLPLYFIAMPNYKSVISFTWTKQEAKELLDEEPSQKLICALEGGTLVELLVPTENDFDNTVSYFYPDVKILRRLDFLSIKSELMHNEEMELERLAEERINAAVEAENRKLIEDGVETESQQNIRLLDEAEEIERLRAEMHPQPKWEPYIPPEQSPISIMIPSVIDHNEVFLLMAGYDTGYLYTMHFEESDKQNTLKENFKEPVASRKIDDCKDNVVTAFTMTNEGDYIFLGFSDGRIRIQNIEYPYVVETIDKHWTEGIHDCVRGQVTSLCLDKDGVFLITTGADGNCFLLSRLLERDLEAYVRKESLQPVEVVEIDGVPDIVDQNAYTLEVFKRVEKEMALLAEAKKNKTAKREEIARLRIRYLEVVKRNNELPEDVRLTPIELALTTDKEARIKSDFEAALKQLKFETAWHTEKANLSLEKLKNYYKDHIACELFELRAFNSSCNLWSFRLSVLPPWFDEAKEKIETHVTPYSVASDIAGEDISPSMSESIYMLKKPVKTRDMDKFTYQKLVRLWERKQKKIKRAKEWKAFLRTEPKSKELKEEDKAIDEARANLGDMKLKSAVDYIVPESKKLTEHRGRCKLVKLEEKIYMLKEDFNGQMLKLRQEKVEKLARMRGYRDKIVEFQKKLSEEDRVSIPDIKEMVISEDPDRILRYTMEDVKEYKRQIEEKLKAAAPEVKVVKKQEGPAMKRKNPVGTLQKPQAAVSRVFEKNLKGPEERSLESFVEIVPEVLTPMEKQIRRVETVKAKYWQNHYIEKIDEEKLVFDSKLKLLRHRKLKLDFLLKNADERMTLLTLEFILAHESEALEASLETKIHDTSKDKRECTNILKSLNKKLENIKKEMEAIGKQKSALLNEVIALAASKAPNFERYLTRVFNKKMPKVRAQPSALTSGASNYELDSDEEESSDESDYDMDLSEEEDDGMDVDFPPPELNKEVYDNVLEIREQRLKVDEGEASIREQMEEVNVSIAQHKQRIAADDRELEKGRRGLDVFRKDKQEKQNALNCAVSLRLHQIEHLDKDLSNVLVTENFKINQLQQRIPELRKEKVRQKSMGFEMRRLNLQLQKEKLDFQRRIKLMEKRCDEEMLKKFGQIRPLDELEFFTVEPRITHLKQELKSLENQQQRELLDVKAQIIEATVDRAAHTIGSISRINTVAQITSRVHYLNKRMEEQMSKLPSECDDTITNREMAFLKVLLTDQWNMISALSLEIAQLTEKSTQPLPPIKSKRTW